jgi:hypothetical protein
MICPLPIKFRNPTEEFPRNPHQSPVFMKLNISDSVPEFGANMAQVTLWKFFSGVPKFDGDIGTKFWD